MKPEDAVLLVGTVVLGLVLLGCGDALAAHLGWLLTLLTAQVWVIGALAIALPVTLILLLAWEALREAITQRRLQQRRDEDAGA